MTTRTRVLILCTANSAQSQMAEGLLRHIDISRQRSKSVDEFIGQAFDDGDLDRHRHFSPCP
jgi:hypothetical protein